MRAVPRHEFVPEDLRGASYQDRALPIGFDRFLAHAGALWTFEHLTAFLLLLGVLVFAFYQFQADTPVFFNRVEWARVASGPSAATFRALEERHAALHREKQERIHDWAAARTAGEPKAEAAAGPRRQSPARTPSAR